MSKLPSISDALDEKMVTSVINKKFNNFVPAFYKFVSEWIINAYSNFKDIEMYMVLIYLVNNDFKFYRKNGIQVDYDTFYKDKTLEIEEIKIIEISRDLHIPKESVRRKIIYLEKIGVIKRTKKKIFIDRSAYETVQPISALKNISYLISISSKILKKENEIPYYFSSNEILEGIKKHFSFCWYEFYKFIFYYYFRWRKELGDFETLCIGLLLMSNASSNKDLVIQDISIEKWRKRISYADKVGLNSMSISDITGIPRPTVVRKVNSLIKKGYAKIDQKNRQQLATSEKDQAENLMIVDLLRNDLSVFAETGSVKTPKLFEVESFAQVHHLVSEIQARLKPEINPLEMLLQALPGGSITGAPKIRAMQIIDELEGNARGAYCGSLGYFNYDGTGRFNILIRSLQRYGDALSIWAGGGITVASNFDAEYQECLDKVSALLDFLNQFADTSSI